jgi:hypothetical protein
MILNQRKWIRLTKQFKAFLLFSFLFLINACAPSFQGTLTKPPHWLSAYKAYSKDGKAIFTVGQSSDYMVIEARKNFAAYQAKEKIKEALLKAIQQKITQIGGNQDIKAEEANAIVQSTYTELIFEREALYYDAPNHIQYALVRVDQAELKLKLGMLAKRKNKAWENWIQDHFESIFASLQDLL